MSANEGNFYQEYMQAANSGLSVFVCKLLLLGLFIRIFLDQLRTEQVWQCAESNIQEKASRKDDEQDTFTMPKGIPIPFWHFSSSQQCKKASNAE